MSDTNGDLWIKKHWPLITASGSVILTLITITAGLLTCLHEVEAKADRANTRIDNLETRLIRIEKNQDDIKTLLIDRRGN